MKDNQEASMTITCIDCGETFDFTHGEQAYFRSKQLSEPKRCPKCRRIRRLSIVPDEAARGDL
jgi:DNA-directed RNA polymerase subunit RPC12/RpoP